MISEEVKIIRVENVNKSLILRQGVPSTTSYLLSYGKIRTVSGTITDLKKQNTIHSSLNITKIQEMNKKLFFVFSSLP